MMRGADAPLWPDATTRFPVLVFSHGYGGSPISNDYIYALTVFASFGYVVVAPFHTDATFSDLKLDNVSDVIYLLTHLQNFLAMQALRPLSLSASLDLVLAQPQWRGRVDTAQIGAFGASMGGESVMLMAGAGLTTSVGLSWTQIENDTRLKAAVGYVPYFGQPIFPGFGRDQHGLDGVNLSFLGISGTADIEAPIEMTAQGMLRLGGPRELVALSGVKHGFDVASTNDIFTWSVTYLDAEIRGDLNARARLAQMTSVAGGGDDVVVIPFNGSAAVNFSGLWWAAGGTESGWGTNFAHQGDQIFATWYTYDTSGKAWWLSMLAARTSPTSNDYTGNIYVDQGPTFESVGGSGVATQIGTGTLSFTDRNGGSFAYTVNGVPQTKALTRYDLATGPQVSVRTVPRPRTSRPRPITRISGGRPMEWNRAGALRSRIRAMRFSRRGTPTTSTGRRFGCRRWSGGLERAARTTGRSCGPRGPDSMPTIDEARCACGGNGDALLRRRQRRPDDHQHERRRGLPMVQQTRALTRFPFAPSGGTLCH